jgi:hypothetical protein
MTRIPRKTGTGSNCAVSNWLPVPVLPHRRKHPYMLRVPARILRQAEISREQWENVS